MIYLTPNADNVIIIRNNRGIALGSDLSLVIVDVASSSSGVTIVPVVQYFSDNYYVLEISSSQYSFKSGIYELELVHSVYGRIGYSLGQVLSVESNSVYSPSTNNKFYNR